MKNIESVKAIGASRPKKISNRYIIMAKNEQDAGKLSALTGRNPHISLEEDLSIIHGAAVEITGEDTLKTVRQLQKQGLIVFEDKKVQVPQEPREEDIQPPVRMHKVAQMYDLKKLHEQGITGKGVGVAVVDSGVMAHEDYKDRISLFIDLTAKQQEEPYDEHGHGTHVTGIIAGNGKRSKGKYVGVAPESNIIGIKVLNHFGGGYLSAYIKGIQLAVENMDEYNIKVLNFSLGLNQNSSYHYDPMAMAVEEAVKSGLTVVVAGGNEGHMPGTISTPGIAPDAITVGGVDDRSMPYKRIARFSSYGPTRYDQIMKPDVVAPGYEIYSTSNTNNYVDRTGTSMSTPIVSGLAAMLYQLKPDLTPEEVKEIIKETATPFPNEPEYAQGKGEINPEAAVQRLKEKYKL